MNNIAVNEVTSNMIQRDYDDKYHIRVALPSDLQDDNSNDNSKKTKKALRKALQKQMQAPPKLDKYTTANMAPKALANVYQNLTNEQKENFLDEIANQNGAMVTVYNALPDSAKNEFLATVTKVLIKKAIEIYKGLSTQDQSQLFNQVNNIIESMPPAQRNALLSQSEQLGKHLGDFPWPREKAMGLDPHIEEIDTTTFYDVDSYSNGDVNSGISNIMMILVQIFCQSMNVESMDMLQQIQDADFNNKFMEIQKQQLEDNVANLDAKSKDAKPWYDKWGVWVTIGIIVLAVVAFTLFPLLLAAPEIEAVAAVEGEATASAAAEEGASAAAETPIGEGDDDVEMDEKRGDASPELQPPEIDDEPINSEPQAKAQQEIQIDQATQTNQNDAIEKAGKTETTGKEGPKMRQPKFGERFDHIFENKKGTMLWNAVKNLVFGGVGFFAANLALSKIWPDAFIMGVPGQVSQTKLTEYSQKAQLSGTIVDQINNKLQLDSRNESNDSDKINQYANFVNQAINMYGQAFVTRT